LTPLSVKTLSFSYDVAEDRMLLLVTDGGAEARPLWLTRRLTALLLDHLARLLKRSSAEVTLAPQDVQDDLIQLEHSRALAETTSSPQPAGTRLKEMSEAGKKDPRALVTDVRITVSRTAFVLTFLGGDAEVAAAELSRAHVHRVLELLVRKSSDCGWALDQRADWLGAPIGRTSLN
jgi:hypothetical protein